MAQADSSLRHLAFFEALAALDEANTAWRDLSAGLVALRLVDGWLAEGPALVARNAWSVRAVRDAVAAMTPGNPARAILGGLVDAMAQAPAAHADVVTPRLMAYGRALDFAGEWRLAADVFETVVTHTHPADDPDLAIDANMRLGYCARMLGDLEAAAVAYRHAGQIATRAGDIVKVLRAQIADAKLARMLGNLPGAETMLEHTIREAEGHGLVAVRAMALHDRAAVAHDRGDFERAVHLAYDSLRGTDSPMERDRVLTSIATFFNELGVRTAARDAFLVLAATAQEQYMRWVATINLLEVAALDRCEPAFEQYRRQLDDASLPPTLEVEYLVHLGEGYRLFGRMHPARTALARAAIMAAEHHMNLYMFRAESALGEIDAGTPAVPTASVIPSEEVRYVADAISELRVLAGVPA